MADAFSGAASGLNISGLVQQFDQLKGAKSREVTDNIRQQLLRDQAASSRFQQDKQAQYQNSVQTARQGLDAKKQSPFYKAIIGDTNILNDDNAIAKFKSLQEAERFDGILSGFEARHITDDNKFLVGKIRELALQGQTAMASKALASLAGAGQREDAEDAFEQRALKPASEDLWQDIVVQMGALDKEGVMKLIQTNPEIRLSAPQQREMIDFLEKQQSVDISDENRKALLQAKTDKEKKAVEDSIQLGAEKQQKADMKKAAELRHEMLDINMTRVSSDVVQSISLAQGTQGASEMVDMLESAKGQFDSVMGSPNTIRLKDSGFSNDQIEVMQKNAEQRLNQAREVHGLYVKNQSTISLDIAAIKALELEPKDYATPGAFSSALANSGLPAGDQTRLALAGAPYNNKLRVTSARNASTLRASRANQPILKTRFAEGSKGHLSATSIDDNALTLSPTSPGNSMTKAIPGVDRASLLVSDDGDQFVVLQDKTGNGSYLMKTNDDGVPEFYRTDDLATAADGDNKIDVEGALGKPLSLSQFVERTLQSDPSFEKDPVRYGVNFADTILNVVNRRGAVDELVVPSADIFMGLGTDSEGRRPDPRFAGKIKQLQAMVSNSNRDSNFAWDWLTNLDFKLEGGEVKQSLPMIKAATSLYNEWMSLRYLKQPLGSLEGLEESISDNELKIGKTIQP